MKLENKKRNVKQRIETLLEVAEWKLENVFIDITDNGESINRWRSIKKTCEEILKLNTITKSNMQKQVLKLEVRGHGARHEGKLSAFLVAKGSLDLAEFRFLEFVGVNKQLLESKKD